MIRVLDDEVINKIAAGEVVERPASIVKELVENALDAGATRIVVELSRGGRELVAVSDDGSGMGRADAELCLQRHATSKIRSAEDLFAIDTLGFRGEAIPSIASVGRFELLTRPAEDPVGTRVVVDGGRLQTIEDAGGPPGTEVRLATLFFNLPARRKFLRTPTTELGHCLDAVTRQIMLRPELDVEVTHDGHTVLRAPPVADLKERAAAILGKVGETLLPVSFTDGELEVEGLLSPVGVHRSSARGGTWLYVNGRFVADRVVRRGVNQAYRDLVPRGRFPVVVLNLRVPPDQVDVNVHPAKTEVRFRHGLDLSSALARGLTAALEEHGLRRVRPVEANIVGPEGRAGEQLALHTNQGPLYVSSPEPATAAAPLPPRPTPLRTPKPAVPLPRSPRAREQPRGTPGRAPPPASPRRGPTPGGEGLPTERFLELRLIGQHRERWILAEGGDQLVLIDQYAAHQRITRHRLEEQAALGEAGQLLADPALVELSPAELKGLLPLAAVLGELGLELEHFGGTTVVVKQVPRALLGVDPQELLEAVAELPARSSPHALTDTLARFCPIRPGTRLSPYEQRALLAALDELPLDARRGRVLTSISEAELLERVGKGR